VLANLQEREPEGMNELPLQPPYHWNDSGWVANRWAELMPLPPELKHRLMVLDSPLLRQWVGWLLVAAALMHSAIVTERRGSLASWTVLLAILGFGLAMLGTFLVRSGVLTSVHAFAVDPSRGIAVLVLLAIAMGVGFTLYARRAGKLGEPMGFAGISRESMLVWNNVGLAVAAGVVLIGTLYPLLVEALGGGLISVGPPFFNLTVAPLMGVLFLLLPIGPMLTWRVGDLRQALMRLAPAGVLAVGTLIAALIISGGRVAPAIGLALGVWLIIGGLIYLWLRIARGEGGRFAKLLALPLAVWAMSVAHIGAGVLTLGAIAETAFRQERAVSLAPGQGVTFAGRTIALIDVGDVEGANYSATRARLRVESGGAVSLLETERRFYTTASAPTTEVGILGALDGDLYIALGEAVRDQPGVWGLRLYYNPLVQLVFVGAAMMGLAAPAHAARNGDARTEQEGGISDEL